MASVKSSIIALNTAAAGIFVPRRQGAGSFFVASNKQGLEFGNIFGIQSEIPLSAVFPFKSHRLQTIDNIKAARKWLHIGFVVYRR